MTTFKKLITVISIFIAMTLALVLSAFVLDSQPGLAQDEEPTAKEAVVSSSTSAFIPPRNARRRSGYRTTTGTRPIPCVGNSQSAFVALGPSETVGLTVSDRPQFTWHLPPSNILYPVQFTLLAANEAGDLDTIHTADLTYSEGIVTYSLPAEVAALSSETEYLWKVAVICDASDSDQSLTQERIFEVVAPSSSLQQKLETATTTAERALAYGEEGLWYDAIAQVATANDSESQAVRQSLLTDLAQIESENINTYEDTSANIYKIIEQSSEL
jgi:hypothetical protein